jgi:hypothetical protein
LRSDRYAAIGALAIAALATACEFERVGIPQTETRLALHAVLSATASTQVVLLERTRNGSIMILAPSFDVTDPVVSDEGVAESNASVRVVTPAGDTLLAPEDNTVRGDRKGAGIYRFALPGSALARGSAYQLLVVTAGGDTIRGETTVPDGTADLVREVRAFDRSSDTVVISWAASASARAYFVRIETPFGPLAFFTDSTHVRLTGELRNADVQEIPRVFFPGFPQAVTVSAVDSNYYDWVRSQTNTLTGLGLVHRLRGALGLFGSLVRLHLEELQVTVPQTESFSGTFQVVDAVAPPYLSLTLYLESRASKAGQANAVSGRYQVRPRLGYSGCLECGLLGTEKDGDVELALVNNWSARDTLDVFYGTLRGDTLVGNFRGYGGPFRFVRAP